MSRARGALPGLAWFVLATVASVAAHVVGVAVASSTGRAMRGVSPLAGQAADAVAAWEPAYRYLAFALVTVFSVAYMAPLWHFFASPPPRRATPEVQRRVLSAPLVLALVSLSPWVASVVLWVGLTVARFGAWSGDMASEQVISPLISGTVAATTQYLLLEWLFRERVAPEVFPDGRLSAVEGARSLPVTARLFVLVFALGFAPVFSLLGLIAAAENRAVAETQPVLRELLLSANRLFVFFVLTGAGYALLFARSLTAPLVWMARALEDIRRGRVDVRVPVRTRDEVGALAEGVNDLASSLREREHILRTFGRIVEPGLRDRLLSGTASPLGERREAAVLFADVRSFTLYAEKRAPEEVVQTLNALFGILTAEVRRAGGSVDKFLGDGMLAVFGLFDEDGDRGGAAAVRAALSMREEVARFAAARADRGDAPVNLAIGVHAGPLVAATLGAEDRFDYTVVGDVVNVASRLLDVAKERGRDLVVSSEAFARATRGGFHGEADWCGPVELRGREAPIEACTLRGA